jgi:hypothetical protein
MECRSIGRVRLPNNRSERPWLFGVTLSTILSRAPSRGLGLIPASRPILRQIFQWLHFGSTARLRGGFDQSNP